MKTPKTFIKDRFAAIKRDIQNAPGTNALQKATVAYEQLVYEQSICRGAIFYASHTNQINEIEEKLAFEVLTTETDSLTNYIDQTIQGL